MIKHHIAFVLPNISGGGAARVAAILCREWLEAGHEVHLITYEKPGAVAVYPLDSRVEHHQIGLSVSPAGTFGFLFNNTRRVLRLRRTFRRIRPTAVVAFLAEANMTAVVAGFGLGAPVLISERTHPAHAKTSTLKRAARRFIYPLAARLCVQTQEVQDWYQRNLSIESRIIPNPAPVPNAGDVEKRPAHSGRRRAVSLGRLDPVKGFDRLIDAFATIAPQVPDWDLVIHGEGALRAALEKRIAELGMVERVSLPGATRTPMAELHASDLYIHSALYEGSPNAVLEALGAGLCVVATDSPGSVGEILQGGKHGILVPNNDVPALADTLLHVMQDDALRAHYALQAHEAVRDYAPDVIAALWINEIENCLSNLHSSRHPAPIPDTTP